MMQHFWDVLKIMFQKISEVLDIFDLSFFVSGATTFGAVLYYLNVEKQEAFKFFMSSGFKFPATIIGCYVFGLVCFAWGRTIRGWGMRLFRKSKMEIFYEAVKTHGFESREPYDTYCKFENHETRKRDLYPRLGRLYTLFWAHAREEDLEAKSLGLLNRYWVMTATYDGVACSFLIWAGVMYVCKEFFFMGIFLFFAVGCVVEAWKYAKYQAEELAATMIYKTRDKRGNQPKL